MVCCDDILIRIGTEMRSEVVSFMDRLMSGRTYWQGLRIVDKSMTSLGRILDVDSLLSGLAQRVSIG